jgi:hypothetical protein
MGAKKKDRGLNIFKGIEVNSESEKILNFSKEDVDPGNLRK